jgi:NAD(P)-dependent dehydrogenase (short-subunit alcohol dehydrogenase family)
VRVGKTLQDKIVVVVGRGTGIARAVALLAQSEGARVVVAGRDQARLAGAYSGSDITTEVVDITDDGSIAGLAERVGLVDHVVSTASARVRGKLADLQRQDLRQSFDTKVIGPTMLAKYFAPQINPGGSFVLFSGVHAFKLNVGYLGVGITNGAVDFLTRWLAVELAPVRVNAMSPGVIDTGAWDSLGDEGKREYFEHIAASNPARRIGTPGRYCRCRAVRNDEHLCHRNDVEGRRRRTAGLVRSAHQQSLCARRQSLAGRRSHAIPRRSHSWPPPS